MLDNFEIPDIETAKTICNNNGYTAQLEVSGNINLETIALYRDTPVDRISVGKLTHSALDLAC